MTTTPVAESNEAMAGKRRVPFAQLLVYEPGQGWVIGTFLLGLLGSILVAVWSRRRR